MFVADLHAHVQSCTHTQGISRGQRQMVLPHGSVRSSMVAPGQFELAAMRPVLRVDLGQGSLFLKVPKLVKEWLDEQLKHG